ncbi:MAG: hypothetical protein WCH11_02635, partial [Bdellovibrio sp.]
PDFSLEQLLWLKSEWDLWWLRQRAISQSYHLLPLGAGRWPSNLVKHFGTRAEMSELVEMLKVPRALQLEGQGRVYLGEREIPMSFAAVTQLNWLMSLIRLSIRSYAGETRRMDPLKPGSGLFREELRELFVTFQPLLVNMGLVARNNMRFVDSRFLEANVFMPRSDGNQILSYFEAVEMGSLIVSGLKIDAELKQQIEARCLVMQSKAVALKSVNAECVMDVYRDEMQLALASVPLFAKYVQSLSTQDFQKLMSSILIAAGSANPLKQPLIYRELSLVPHVIQFLESITSRFDLNRDGILSKEEALASFPLFHDLIRSFPGVDSESRAYAGFSYILKFGRAPSSTREKLKFLWWSFFPSRWKFQVDRSQLASIFSFIQKCGTSGQQCSEAELRILNPSEEDFEKEFPEMLTGLAPSE